MDIVLNLQCLWKNDDADLVDALRIGPRAATSTVAVEGRTIARFAALPGQPLEP